MGSVSQGFAPKTDSAVGVLVALAAVDAAVAAVEVFELEELLVPEAPAAVEPLVEVDELELEEGAAAAATVCASSFCESAGWVDDCRAAGVLATARSAA